MTKSERMWLNLAMAKLLVFEQAMGSTEIPQLAREKYEQASECIWRALEANLPSKSIAGRDVYDVYVAMSEDNLNDHPLDKLLNDLTL